MRLSSCSRLDTVPEWLKGRGQVSPGGWAHGPCEAWAFAARLASGGDRDKRMAMLIVDNAVELALKTYLNLHHSRMMTLEEARALILSIVRSW
jgi:hypothetical protein